MRILLWVTLGFSGAAALWAGLDWPFWWLAGLACCLGFFAYPLRRLRIPALLAGGLGLGLLWCSLFGLYRLTPVRQLGEGTRQMTVTVTDFPTADRRQYCSADGRVTLRGQSYPVRLYLQGEPPRPGDRIRGSFRVTSALQSGSNHRGMGIYLLAWQEGESLVLSGAENSPRVRIACLRRSLLDRLDRIFLPDTAGFAKALLLGDSRSLSDRDDWNLTVSGIRHVTAVSGLHVTILYVVLSLVTLRRGKLTAVLGLPMLVLFCAVTGFPPSAVRASLMLGLMLVSHLVNREYDPLTELSFAVLVMLAANPLVITSVSFQMSAASVLGILTLCKPLYGFFMGCLGEHRGLLKRILGCFCASWAVSFSALAAVTPLTALHFGTVSLIAPLTNLLTVWAVVWCFWGILPVLALSFVTLRGAQLLALPVSLLIRYVLGTAAVLGKFPLAAVYTASPYVGVWLGLTYALFLLAGRRKRPGLCLGSSAALLLAALLLSWLPARLGLLEMTVLDVGQGQCILLQSGDQAYVVDCGGDYGPEAGDLAARHLRSRGIFSLEGLILTHFDEDHVGGAETLLTRVPARAIYVPAGKPLRYDPRLVQTGGRLELPTKTGKLTVFPGETGVNSNDGGLCVLFAADKYAILITGDRSEAGEKALMARYSLPKVEILVAGHHGAKTSTCPELLEAVRPEIVVISAGRQNRYGHPHPETLLRLRAYGCQVLRTDRQGTITIRR